MLKTHFLFEGNIQNGAKAITFTSLKVHLTLKVKVKATSF